MGFGGYIGYTTNYVNTATAHEVNLPRLVDVPRTNGFNLDINLNNGLIACNSQEQGVNVKIERKDSIIYKTRVVTKKVIKYVKVREIPSFALKPLSIKETIKLNNYPIENLCKLEPNPNSTQHQRDANR